MNVVPAEIPDVLVLEPVVFPDERGFFYESYNRRVFRETTGIDVEFVQDNHSRSSRGVLRGLHFQNPHAQGKLVRATDGRVFVVAVDLRRPSATCGRICCLELSDANRRMLWVPPGFANGFLVLSERADVLYKTTEYYAPDDEHVLAWNDPQLGIPWPLEREPALSAKDRSGRPLREIELYP